MVWKIILLPFWIVKKGLGLVFILVNLVLGALRLIFGGRVIALGLLIGGFFLGKKLLKEKNGENQQEPSQKD